MSVTTGVRIRLNFEKLESDRRNQRQITAKFQETGNKPKRNRKEAVIRPSE